MKESDDEIDDIFNDGHNYYYQGLAAGQEQASNYSMAEIEAEGFAFGQEYGEEIAYYEQFLKAFREVQGPNQTKFSPKILAAVKNMQEGMQRIQLQKIDSIKAQRKELAYRFKVLLAMLGIKEYTKVNQESKEIKEQEEGFDF